MTDTVARAARPVRGDFLPFSPPLIEDEEIREVVDTLRSPWITTGPKTQRFEAEFAAAPDFTDDLTFKYFILVNGTLLAGEVTHSNIAAGRENHSVMYVSPRTLARFNNNRPVTQTAVQNIAVQIVQQGAIKGELSLLRAPAQWYVAMPKVTGFVLNKNETPFAPLFWDRYEQIKSR